MTVSDAPPRMAFASVYPNEVPVSFLHSWTNFLMFDLAHWGTLTAGPGLISVRYGTDGLPAARNTVVERFLKSDADWLLWVDSDMGYAPADVYKLLAAADPTSRPIVGGLCFASREYAGDGMGGYLTRPSPTIFQWADVDGVRQPTGGHQYPVNSLVRCAATGSAFVVIHRGVFEAIGGGWYDRMPADDGKLMGEDISFCVRAAGAGFPTHVYTGARTSHFKPQWVQERDYWSTLDVPPAVDDVAVLVPVTRRPAAAAPFMASLRASTGLATVYALVDDDDQDTAEAWRAAGAQTITGRYGDRPGTFAEKVNAGARQVDQPWLMLVGDDVRFRPGWLDHAQHTARQWGASVVGVNDGGGDARTAAGEHAAHLLVARDYVDRVGASWDGPGVVCHEGYRHWYVDDEIVTAAKQRGVWQMALGAVVEHLHPLFGRADTDDVYRLGQQSVDADRALFAARKGVHGAR